MSIFSQRFYIFGKRFTSGFTIIELLVAVSIVVIITLVLLFRHEQFNSSTLLRSLSYSVALSVRQAQLYGTSVRETEIGAGVFASSYAIYFKTGSPNEYFLAADVDRNGILALDGSEDVSPSPYKIQSGYGISNFCAYLASGTAHCYSNGIIDVLAITFERPNPDAFFITNVTPSTPYRSGCIELISPGEDTRTVNVSNTGQISVGEYSVPCPN